MLKLNSQTILYLLYSVEFAKLDITDKEILKELGNKKNCKLFIILIEGTNSKKHNNLKYLFYFMLVY
jgi:hypothetical protein